jgi:hypothetical protein
MNPPGAGQPRPLGVWWARTAAAAGSRMCEDATHPVYRRLHQRAKPGQPNETHGVEVWACGVCWPPDAHAREQADALAAAAARTANKTHGRHFDGES